VNAGYGFSDRNNDDDFFNTFAFGGTGLVVPSGLGGLAPVVPVNNFNTFGFTDTNRNRDGFVGGGQIGYNFQFTPGNGFVVGVEADIQYTDFGRRNNDNNFGAFGFNGIGNGTGIFTAGLVPSTIPGTGILAPTGVGNGALGNVAVFNGGNGLFNNNNFARHDWFATVRGRLGYAIDRLLIYGTGGVAFRDNGNNNTNDGFFFGNGITSGASLVGTGFYRTAGAAVVGATVAPNNTFGFFSDRNNNDVGWTVGGGLEYAFTNNLTAKIEGLYVSFDRNRNDNNGFFLGNNVVGVSNTGAAITAGQLGFGTGLGFDNRRNRDDFAVVRAGLNYKFGTF
jgi:outer membrane immunogenic protein